MEKIVIEHDAHSVLQRVHVLKCLLFCKSDMARTLRFILGDLSADTIELDIKAIRHIINDLIADAGQINLVFKEDQTVYQTAGSGNPTSFQECIDNGARFFDSVYSLTLPGEARPETHGHMDVVEDVDHKILMV